VTAERIELLAPAKDGPTARAAILCGADAVYIGAEHFSAREAAGNTLSTIQQVTAFAHQYYARVCVALNTLLRDDELLPAEKMIHQFYDAGVDGLIIQDVGLLELDLPPLPLIASTQMHNAAAERVKFWEEVGFSRAILARELTLEQIRHIRRQTQIELEGFIHGALCVGASGQCYMSYAIGGRSGNRGQCAQPCRRLYSLKDGQGRTIVKDRHLLSLKDLSLVDHLEELIDAGITSFKIEGRLKDLAYVANTVGFYRQKLDSILSKKGLRRASSGSVHLAFEPNLEKTFNRGYTDYGLTGPAPSVASIDTPKSIGEYVGTVTRVEESCFSLDKAHDLHNADGLCFFDRQQNLDGTVVNRVEGERVYPQKMQGIRNGQKIYRNFDYVFSRQFAGRFAERKIGMSMFLRETPSSLALTGIDEDGNQATVEVAGGKQPAQKKEAARQTILTQLAKLGNTIFECSDLQIQTGDTYFLPVSQLNAAKRELVQRLLQVREANRPRPTGGVRRNDVPFPERHLTYTGNVLNSKARAFYERHGVETISPAAESGLDLSRQLVMTTKYCLRKELGLCPGNGSRAPAEPLLLVDEDGREYELHFRCGQCGMEVFFGHKEKTL
jgi:collagenase-like PrtC family protease